MPSDAASLVSPPARTIARSKGVLSDMGDMSSTASQISQAPLHLQHQATLYSVDMTLGAQIKRARIQRGMSLEELGEKIGVSRQLVWQWERNKSDPRKHIEALCLHLEVPYEYFYGRDHNQPGTSSLETKIKQLDSAQQQLVESMVDAMLRQSEAAEEKIVK